MKDLAGKVAVITGSGRPRGIGRATGKLLADNGMKLVLADVEADVLDATVKELRSDGADVIGVPTDVADYAAMKSLADAAFDHFGKVHVAHFNAAGGESATLLDDDMAAWERTIAVNVLGVLHGIKAFVPRMHAQAEPGHVLATSSGAGVTGVMYTLPSYALTKQSVYNLMEILYGELRDMNSLLKATVVFPPTTNTNEFMPMISETLEAAGVPAPLVEPEDVAETVLRAILEDSFWAHQTIEEDAKYTGGRTRRLIEWEHEIVRARAEAYINRTAPDPYLWGIPPPTFE
jgi:NAD(P)-dependent dehydrogenase (short-subunit alcohol dehydrogenase family)